VNLSLTQKTLFDKKVVRIIFTALGKYTNTRLTENVLAGQSMLRPATQARKAGINTLDIEPLFFIENEIKGMNFCCGH
jgi:hypothetical protein